jgi:hypothetical protein
MFGQAISDASGVSPAASVLFVSLQNLLILYFVKHNSNKVATGRDFAFMKCSF